MKKKIHIRARGYRADVGPIKVNRILSNRYVEAVGPFVFLDHALPVRHSADEPRWRANGEGAHPHRGIATLTYILSGEVTHLDSKGHFAKVSSGGVQWMKAGDGVIHDEVVNPDPQTGDLLTQGLQFWIDLPAKNKAEKPEYLSVTPAEVPMIKLDDQGWLKVILGEYKSRASKIPNYTGQFIYHVHVASDKQFTLETTKDWEYAAFLPMTNAIINDREYKQGEFLLFDRDNGSIDIDSVDVATDIILFGGEPYAEPIVAQGPFVMNTQHEISQAYNDFYEGKYGEIDYSLAD